MSRAWGAARAAIALAHRLGPWGGEAPIRRVVRRSVSFRDEARGRSVRAYVYAPRGGVRGAYLISPGLHFLGPDDPRLDRFCRALADAGFEVTAPFLSGWMRLTLEPALYDELAVALEAVLARCERQGWPAPGLFSISFGSSPAFAVASDPRFSARIGGLLLFGGFYDFEATVRFAITGRAIADGVPTSLPHDPLNPPVVFLNLLPELGLDRDDEELLRTAWTRIVHETWGRMELKAEGALDPWVDRAAGALPARVRDLFRLPYARSDEAERLFETTLARASERLAFMQPAPMIGRLATDVVVVHGKDDDVIPWTESVKLHDALPGNKRLLLTGLYGHTGSATPDLADALQEARAMVGIVGAMSRVPQGSRRLY